MARIARISPTAAKAIRDMGDSGVDLALSINSKTDGAIKALTADIVRLGKESQQSLTEYAYGVQATTQQTQEFNANLVKLAKMGFGDLATQLGAMGVDQAGQFAANAATNNNAATIAQQAFAGQTALQNAPSTQDTVKLITWLQKQTGTPGLRDAARGTSFTDQYIASLVNGNISNIGGMPQAAKLIKDAASFAAGTFYAQGGINQSAQIRSVGEGPVVWNEHTAGGESWIPHARSKRKRALRIWAQTGQILGADGYSTPTPFANGGFGATPARSALGSPAISAPSQGESSGFNQYITFQTEIYNPLPESPSESINKTVTAKAQLGVFGRKS
jgi:hypothetical protein